MELRWSSLSVRGAGFSLVCALAACSSATSDSSTSVAAHASAPKAPTSTSRVVQSTKLPDGATEETSADGSVTITKADGTTVASRPPLSLERAVAAKLGTDGRFLVGLGNDANGNGAEHRSGYGLGQPIDIHYMYLSGMTWPTWNTPAGAYVTFEANAAKEHGAIAMFTLYQAATYGDGNLAPFGTDDFMTKYWANVKLLFTTLDSFGAPSIVHVEPDFWGYAEKRGDSSATPVKVNDLVPECKDLPNDVSGMGKCIIRLARSIAPQVVIGFSASAWGSTSGGVSQPDKIAAFMKSVGADQADILVLETLDRDAGCFEAATDPNCQRSGSFYWTQQNFTDHLAWAKKMRDGVGLPLLWWQMPLGVPSSSYGSALHYRDNRVQYLFAHPDQFAAAGGIGAVFGPGAANQTTVETDGGQFEDALAGYLAAPVPLK